MRKMTMQEMEALAKQVGVPVSKVIACVEAFQPKRISRSLQVSSGA
jgi:hypothetical protein